MALSPEDVAKVALLARLRLTDDELRTFTEQLNQIVGYVEQLQELNTEDVEPMAHPLPVRNVFRADEPQTSLSPEEALANAPKRVGAVYLVPAVLD